MSVVCGDNWPTHGIQADTLQTNNDMVVVVNLSYDATNYTTILISVVPITSIYYKSRVLPHPHF